MHAILNYIHTAKLEKIKKGILDENYNHNSWQT